MKSRLHVRPLPPYTKISVREKHFFSDKVLNGSWYAGIDAHPSRHYTARIIPMMIIPNTVGCNASL